MKLNLRVLIYLNPSNINKITHKFMLEADSGFITVKNSILALNEIEDWHFYVLVPKDNIDTCWPDKPKNVTFVPYPYINDALNSRFHFDTMYLKKHFNNYRHDIDLIWTNIPENAGALRGFANKRREEIPIFSYIHWTDFRRVKGYEPAYYLRTLDGFVNSHAIGIQSNHMMNFIKKNLFKGFENAVNYAKVHVINPKTTIPNTTSVVGDVIAFPHRVSQESGFEYMFQLIKPYMKRKMWVSNINSARMTEDPMIINKTFENHTDYYEYLSKIRFGVSYHINYSMWSMSVLDMMVSGKVVLVPKMNAFPEMFSEDYPFFFETEEEFIEKYQYLENCPDSELEHWGAINRKIAEEKFTWSTHAKQLSEVFYSIVRPGDNEKTASVYNAIKEYGMITKGDIINRNLTDYARQCSRAWNRSRIALMRDYGVKDDIMEEYTTFYMPDYDISQGITKRPPNRETPYSIKQKIEKKMIKQESFFEEL